MNKWFNQQLFKAPLFTALAAGSVFASTQVDEINNTLDSVDQAQTGVSFSGEMLSRGLSSEKYGSGLNDAEPTVENHFFTQMDLSIKGRPSAETQATLIFRLHQDWNNYYDEGANPFNTRWMSYDGTIGVLGGTMDFNLGDFKFKKSPLVAWSPSLSGLEYEAEIFTRKRDEAAADRFLGDNYRHLQGINATYTLANGKGSSFAMSATGSQLRFPWWSNGIVQYDNDKVAKYLAHVDGNLTVKNLLNAGASFTSIFDVVSATRSHNRFNSTALQAVEDAHDLNYENNFVASFFGGFDWNTFEPKSNLILNARFDIALSTYRSFTDSLAQKVDTVEVIDADSTILTEIPNGDPTWVLKAEDDLKLEDGTAMLAELNVGYKMKSDVYAVKLWGINNNANFVSDLAQSQSFDAKSIFNSANRTGLYAGSNYNSMFDAIYNYAFVVSPVTERTTLETYSPAEPLADKYSGTNNYYRAQYQKNSYTGQFFTRSERESLDANTLAYFQEALPNGKATANRSGGQAELSVDALDNMLSIDGHFGQFENTESAGYGVANEFSRLGAGLVIRLGGVLDYKDGIELTGGMGMTESSIMTPEQPSIDNQSTFVSTGLKVGFLENFELISGLQVLDHDINGYSVIENIGALGLSAKLATGTYLTAEYTHIEGFSPLADYTQGISQMNLRMSF